VTRYIQETVRLECDKREAQLEREPVKDIVDAEREFCRAWPNQQL